MLLVAYLYSSTSTSVMQTEATRFRGQNVERVATGPEKMYIVSSAESSTAH